ncbi:TetR/AcrR family transcriptional regulator [Variovorax saccharolyticus]|uniref:TetR/AcrR family transcriptional regulator n=1 Tax=Variovorax saccharolyticus TaxID=3053516 RepID=UPI0025773E7E|nr:MULTISPECIES: TetR/AcrR family transcriptional regulator [unclassified Variovorax]MDM0022261.1 TetR/AcrR family transcriptional regulator [Variovorax sp. J22R187]MDM0028817.1 TetR/AcrR family transcriptional regulator [Variovorax sp. J31P216]
MGHSRENKATTHDRILEVAAEQFKARGLDGIGLAELMKEAGLTHGGFYKHFKSRDALVAETVSHAFDQDEARFAAVAAHSRGDPIGSFIDAYLSLEHRDHTAAGCSMAALGAEFGRASAEVKAAFTVQYQRRRAWVATNLGGPAVQADRHAATLMNAMIGALTVARAIDDPSLSRDVLDSSRRDVKSMAKSMQAALRAVEQAR